jgi:hypothetical protein
MQFANPGTKRGKAVARIVGHVKHHYKPIKLRRPLALRVRSHVDTDWASDRNDRKSITSLLTAIGFVCLVNWQCKKQNTVALSSTEAELYGESSAAQDVMFETNMLDEMLGKAVRPSIVYGDNMGAIFLARNLAVGQRTKHIGIRTRFITNLVESKQIKMEHVRSENNPADAASKNCKEGTHVRHAQNIYNGTFHHTIGRVLKVKLMCNHLEESATQKERPSQVGLTKVGLKLPMTVSDPIVMTWRPTESEPRKRSG